MKIGESSKTPGAARVENTRRARSAAAAEKSEPVAPVDQIHLLGVPEAELTPRVRDALMSLLKDIQALRAELARTQARLGDLEKLADHDPLLDVYNRRAFVRELERALAMMDRYAMQASLIIVDLNDLKKINDAMGHGAGDAALAHVARILTAHVRQTDAVGRLGGDEFGVLLMQAGKEVANRKGDELAQLIAASPVSWKGDAFTANISWGAVEIGRGYSAAQAMESADGAMYAAKRRK